MGKTSADCSLVLPKDATPQNFMKKTFANSHKILKFANVFFLKSFVLYYIYSLPDHYVHTCHYWFQSGPNLCDSL